MFRFILLFNGLKVWSKDIERKSYLRGDEQRSELLGEEAVEAGVVRDQDLGDAVDRGHLLGHVLDPGSGASNKTSHLE